MKELMARALETARLKGAQYADVRVVQTAEQGLSVKNGVVDGMNSSESQGLGVRVLVDGCWGFASSRGLTRSEVDRVAGLAAQIARASALVQAEPVVDLGRR